MKSHYHFKFVWRIREKSEKGDIRVNGENVYWNILDFNKYARQEIWSETRKRKYEDIRQLHIEHISYFTNLNLWYVIYLKLMFCLR